MKPTLERVPEDALQLAEEQLDAALQIIAALVLTDAEMHDVYPENNLLKGWAGSMSRELLKDYRDSLLICLKNHGFSTNSHPGFPLSLLSAPNASAYGKALLDAEACALDHMTDGKEQDDLKDYLRQWLTDAGHTPDVVNHTMNRGFQLMCLAEMKRLVRESKGTEA